MRVLARLFGAIASWFETRATAGQMRARIEALEAQQAVFGAQIVQFRTDIAKCKLAVSVGQLMDVSAE